MAISAAFSLAFHAAPSAARRRSVIASASAPRLDRRSVMLLLLSAAGAGSAAAVPPAANAAGNIGFFSVRKRLERAEEAAINVAREVGKASVEAAEAGGEAVAEAGKEVAGEGMELVAEARLAGNALLQAGAVAGAEALGVLVGLSVVNGILKPEA